MQHQNQPYKPGANVNRGRGNMRGYAQRSRGQFGGPSRGNGLREGQVDVQRREPVAKENEVDEKPNDFRPKDPWVAQMSQNYEYQVNKRSQGRGGGQQTGNQTGGDSRTRANKEKNKAHHGNHNRKDRGQWKRNQGML